MEGLALGKEEAVETIFHRDGKPLEQNFIRRIFKRVLDKAGLREIRLHDIRHTYASLLLTDGVTPVSVKEQLGHSSIQMTVDIYGHLIPNSNREAVNRLDFMHPSHLRCTLLKMKTGKSLKTYPLLTTWCRRGDSNPYRRLPTRP